MCQAEIYLNHHPVPLALQSARQFMGSPHNRPALQHCIGRKTALPQANLDSKAAVIIATHRGRGVFYERQPAAEARVARRPSCCQQGTTKECQQHGAHGPAPRSHKGLPTPLQQHGPSSKEAPEPPVSLLSLFSLPRKISQHCAARLGTSPKGKEGTDLHEG